MVFLISVVSMFFYALNLAIFARILLSWLPVAGINVDRYNPIIRVLYDITDPILEPFRRIIPPIGMVDISPIVAVLVLNLVSSLILEVLRSLA